MDFERYRVPTSVRDGVWIELPGTSDAKFLVALPSEHNRAYTAALQRATPVKVETGGKIGMGEFDFVEWQACRVEAFLVHCIRQFPGDLDPDTMRGDFYPGLVALFAAANDLVEDEAKRAKAEVKKSKA